MSVQIIIDSASDMPAEKAKELNIRVIPIPVLIDGREYMSGVDLDADLFYELLKKSKELPKTSQITPIVYEDIYREVLEGGDDVLCITLSSGLSGTYNNALMAADEVGEDFPDRSIRVIDSKQASVAIAIQAELAAGLRDQGKTCDQIADEVEKMQDKLYIIALLDTLEYAKKGGRVSAAAAAIGGLLSIKPVVTIDEEGKLAVIGKARGSSNGNNLLKQNVKNSGGIDFSLPFCLAYSGVSDQMLQNYISDSREIYEGKCSNLPIAVIGPTIGTYSGPGAVAFAYYTF